MKEVIFCTTAILSVFLFNLVAPTATPARAQVERLEEQIRQLTLKVQERQEAAKFSRSRRASSEILNENRKLTCNFIINNCALTPCRGTQEVLYKYLGR